MKRSILIGTILISRLLHAQVPLPQPNLQLVPDGAASLEITALVKQKNGGTIVSGSFVMADQHVRNHLLRLLPDGSLDLNWAPSIDRPASSLAVDSADDVFAAGEFVTVDNVYRPGLAKFSGSGSGLLNTDWEPSLIDTDLYPISRIAIDTADNVFVSRDYYWIRKLFHDGMGTEDAAWQLDLSGNVLALLPDNAGHLYIAGLISSIGNSFPGMKHLVRGSTGSPATVDLSWQPLPPAEVTAVALDGDWLYVGGYFTTIGGQNRNHLARVSLTDGTADALWDPSPQSSLDQWGIPAIAADGSSLLVAGPFSGIGGRNANGIAAVSKTGAGGALGGGDLNPDGAVMGLVVGADNSFLAAGAFSRIGGAARLGLAAFANPELIFSDNFDGP